MRTTFRPMKRNYLIVITGAAAVIAIVFGILVVRRNQRLKAAAKAERYLHQHLPSAEWEPTAKLTATDYTMREGDSLAKIATLRYGHQGYSSVIKLVNHIENAETVAVGATLRVPDISTILAEEGFTKVAAPEMELILCARAKYDKVKTQLWDLRHDRPAREQVPVPQKIKQELLEAADDLQQATESLKANKPSAVRPPVKMIGQLETAMRGIRELAKGSNDGYGYDIDLGPTALRARCHVWNNLGARGLPIIRTSALHTSLWM